LVGDSPGPCFAALDPIEVRFQRFGEMRYLWGTATNKEIVSCIIPNLILGDRVGRSLKTLSWTKGGFVRSYAVGNSVGVPARTPQDVGKERL